MISINTKSNERSIDVAVWNDQTGGWFDLTEARDIEEAEWKVAEYAKAAIAETGSAGRYLIRVTEERELVVEDIEEIVPESDLSPGSLELFLGLAEDASNWSGTPLVTVDAAGKGHLTDLKKRGLLDTFVDEGCSFATFTEAGIALAEEHGVDGSYLRFDFLPKEVDAS